MTFSAPEPVASGCPYTITDVPGHRPAKIEELVGDITFIARTDGHTCHVAGTGMRTGTGVRFHQKDVATGKDLRVWQITVTGDHHFATQAVVP